MFIISPFKLVKVKGYRLLVVSIHSVTPGTYHLLYSDLHTGITLLLPAITKARLATASAHRRHVISDSSSTLAAVGIHNL